MNFEPENLAEYIGHDDPNNPLFYVDEWESDSPQCLMLDGAPGLGKTTAAYLIGKYLELDIVEYKKKLELSQSSIDEITLHIAAGDWTNTHKTMLGMIRAGASLHYLMREIQNYVKSVGLTSERLYTFYVVWGDFVIRMNQWPFDEESFVDYFIASLYNADTKNKEE